MITKKIMMVACMVKAIVKKSGGMTPGLTMPVAGSVWPHRYVLRIGTGCSA